MKYECNTKVKDLRLHFFQTGKNSLNFADEDIAASAIAWSVIEQT